MEKDHHQHQQMPTWLMWTFPMISPNPNDNKRLRIRPFNHPSTHFNPNLFFSIVDRFENNILIDHLFYLYVKWMVKMGRKRFAINQAKCPFENSKMNALSNAMKIIFSGHSAWRSIGLLNIISSSKFQYSSWSVEWMTEWMNEWLA